MSPAMFFEKMKSLLCPGLASLAFIASAGCGATQLAPYSLDTPPVVLAPASRAGIEDGRGRFREVYCAVREGHGKSLPDDKPCAEVVLRVGNEPPATGKPVNLNDPSASSKAHIVVVPGIFSECFTRTVKTYSDAVDHLKKLGYKTTFIQVSGRGSSAFNAKQIRDYVAGNIPADERLIFIGYSKGVPDILEAIVAYPDLRDRTAAVVSIAGVVTGSPMVDVLTRPLQRMIEQLPSDSCPAEDGGALKSLEPATRLNWLATNTLPPQIRYFSLAAFNTKEETADVLRPSYELLSQIDPRNDSQVIFFDAVIPGSVLLGYVKADHFAVAMPFSRQSSAIAKLVNHNAFPREVLLESVVRFVEENIAEKNRGQ